MVRCFLPFVVALAVVLQAQAQTASPAAAPPNPAENEARKCEERIASVQREVLSRYDAGLQELQLAAQKTADLEGALKIRSERQRLAQDSTLTEANFASEPKALRALQAQTTAKMQELIAQLVEDTAPKLVELKRALTIAGRLDEAVAVRAAVERLNARLVPGTGPVAGSTMPVETLLRAYTADRTRADGLYKGQRLTVHGNLVGYRPNPDGKSYDLFLGGSNANGGWMQCTFSNTDVRFHEEKQFNASTLVAVWGANNANSLRLPRGAVLDIAGQCSGWDETARMNRCEFAK